MTYQQLKDDPTHIFVFNCRHTILPAPIQYYDEKELKEVPPAPAKVKDGKDAREIAAKIHKDRDRAA